MSVKPLQARPVSMGLVAGLAVLCAVAGCKKEDAAPEPGASTTAPAAQQQQQQQVAATPAVSEKVAAMDVDALRQAARKAQAEQRLYAPAGDNAVEYYLALRDKAPGDPGVASALTDLMPYTVIATEQSINREDFAEAQRLYALLEKADPNAPALPRLKDSIARQQQAVAQRAEQEKVKAEEEAKRQAELEKQRAADQQRAQQQAAQQLAAQQAEQQRQEQARQAEQQRQAEAAAAAQRAAQQRPAQQPAQTAAARPSASASDLRPISTPAPRYPTEAYRAGTSGEVQVEFTVAADGSVSDVRVVRANPPRVFDREAVSAVKRWRFQPIGAPVTTRRTISFNPGG
ncbi:MAG TPA: energy transducer TonB [Xanthomonadaceae bacterium]|nr:energy transducer TonB [Xanthomonadaceae bacterium]